jgi:hypothetical protein
MIIMILICFTVLILQLGWAFFSGFIILFISMNVNFRIMKKMFLAIRNKRETTDNRMIAVTETLNNIKMIKLYAW